jgi:hypothetical protein
MKPKPLVALNHLTVPIVILLLQDAQMRAAPTRPSRGLDPISAMSWGVEPVRRDQQGKSIIRMQTRLPHRARESKPQETAASTAGRRWSGFASTEAVARRDPDCLREKFAKILFLLRGLTLLG